MPENDEGWQKVLAIALTIAMLTSVLVMVLTANAAAQGADTTLPTFGADSSDGTATALQLFDFGIMVTDDVGVYRVYAVYWTDSDATARASLIRMGGVYVATVTILGGQTLHYYFVAEDDAGNIANSAQVDIAITNTGTTSDDNFSAAAMTVIWILVIVVIVLAVLVVYLLTTRSRGKPPVGKQD